MGPLSFIKDASEKLFGKGAAQAAITIARADPNSAEKAKAANDAAADAILAYVEAQNFKATGLTVTFDSTAGTATVYSIADNQATREKIVLCCGNVQGVEAVNDQMTVDQSQPEAQYYKVVKGDTFSKISKQYYSEPNKYNAIFEANKPTLKSHDLIYPGQTLRTPPQ